MARYSAPRRSLLILPLLASLAAAQHTLVDVEKVQAEGDSSAALRSFTIPAKPIELACDVLIAGGGLGGISAAITAERRGHSVCLTG